LLAEANFLWPPAISFIARWNAKKHGNGFKAKMKWRQEAEVNRSRAFGLMLPFIAASFGQASGKLPAPRTDTAQHAPPSSEVTASPLSQDNVDSQREARYKMQVSVDEVRLTFHAVDKSGRPVDDLKRTDLDLFDNETGPGAIVALQLLKERPLRIAFLIDASGSVSGDLNRSRAIAMVAAKALMQNNGDQGLAIGFRRARDINQPWSSDFNAVADGIRQIGSRPDASLDGTSLFDALWSTCHFEFRQQQQDVQNILLLLSDGVDTSSHATLEQAVGACQQAHTSVFVLTSTTDLSDLSMGHRTLRKLTEETGGSVIQCGGSEVEVSHAIDALATDIRSEYQLFYRPQTLKRDGSFHRIVLVGPSRVAAIVGQSGYYALPK
jgi:VWFA-related protein